MRHFAALPAIVAGLLLSVPACAQAPVSGAVAAEAPEVSAALASIRPAAIRAHMGFLSDDLFEGRRTGTRGYDLAAKYVASRFEALGLEPAGTGGSYFQPVPLVRMTLDTERISLALTRDGKETPLAFGEDFLVDHLAETEGEVSAPVVFVGFGVTAPELGYDDYEGVDVRGKIVAILRGGPKSFPHDQRAYYSDRRVQLQIAEKNGAVGALFLSTPEAERIMPWAAVQRSAKLPALAWRNEAGRPRDVSPRLRAIALLSQASVGTLFEGAPWTFAEVLEAAEEGKLQSFALPVSVHLRTASRREQAESPNVAAILRGSDPKLRDEYVVVSAHLDHLGVGEPIDGDATYNGAIDNAGGIAQLLEIAGALVSVHPRRSVLLLAVTGEEVGLHGSDYFARHPTVPVESIAANVNLDMHVMLYPLRDVIAFGEGHTSLGGTVRQAAARLGLGVSPDPFPEMVIFIRSDHYSFVKRGVPAVFMMGGFETGDDRDGKAIWEKWMQQKYHQPGDDMGQAINFDAGAKFAQLNFLVTYLVAQADERPSWNPGDFFGEMFRRR